MASQQPITGFEDGPRPFRFDFADYERMDEAGMFAKRDGRVELIEGLIVEMAPACGDHTDVTSDLLGQFYVGLRDLAPEFKVLTQGTLRIADRAVKAPMYARAGIPELWIVEPEMRSVTVYRGPRPDGAWEQEVRMTAGEVSPLFAPAIAIILADVFPA